MEEKKFYYVTYILSTTIFLLLGNMLGQLNGNWFLSQLLLIPILLILYLAAVYGALKLQNWTTKVFLQFFALAALDGLLLTSGYKGYSVYAIILVGLIGFVIVFRNMKFYATKNKVDELEREVKQLENAQKEVNEALLKAKSSKKKEPIKKSEKNVLKELEKEVNQLEMAQKQINEALKKEKAWKKKNKKSMNKTSKKNKSKSKRR